LVALRPLPSPSDSYQYINIRSLKRKPTKSIDGDSFLGTDRNREKKGAVDPIQVFFFFSFFFHSIKDLLKSQNQAEKWTMHAPRGGS
jgi:hypothetical protein